MQIKFLHTPMEIIFTILCSLFWLVVYLGWLVTQIPYLELTSSFVSFMYNYYVSGYILSDIILLPLVAFGVLLNLSESKHLKWIQAVSLFMAGYVFLLTLTLLVFFDKLSSGFQATFFLPAYFSDAYCFGVDGISILLIVLVAFMTLLCIFAALRRKSGFKSIILCLFLIEFLCIVVFSVLDILLFYMFFESVLMPMFIMIGVWGSTRSGRIRAAYLFFLYTLAGSILFLIAIMVIYLETGTTNLLVLLNIDFSEKKQLFLWLFAFFGFAVKIPMFPIHIWLPEAHVEAPTEGSVILASILLKLGGYGFLRVSLTLFPYGSLYFLPLVYTLALLGIIYASLTTLVQVDLKKIIAYSSVAHMNLVVLGIFSFKIQGIVGSLFLMLGHGLVSGALFFLVGSLYDRHQTRSILYYGGLAQVMPTFSFFFFFFSIANMSFPGTCNFIGELLILVGLFQTNFLVTFIAATSVVLSAAYSIWLFNRLCFCNIKTLYLEKFRDLSSEEQTIFSQLTFWSIFLGILPDFFLSYLSFSVKCLEVRFFN